MHHDIKKQWFKKSIWTEGSLCSSILPIYCIRFLTRERITRYSIIITCNLEALTLENFPFWMRTYNVLFRSSMRRSLHPNFNVGLMSTKNSPYSWWAIGLVLRFWAEECEIVLSYSTFSSAPLYRITSLLTPNDNTHVYSQTNIYAKVNKDEAYTQERERIMKTFSPTEATKAQYRSSSTAFWDVKLGGALVARTTQWDTTKTTSNTCKN